MTPATSVESARYLKRKNPKNRLKKPWKKPMLLGLRPLGALKAFNCRLVDFLEVLEQATCMGHVSNSRSRLSHENAFLMVNPLFGVS